MFDFLHSNIKNKLLLLLCSTLMVILLAVFGGIRSLNGVIEGYSQTVDQDVTYITQISELNVRFKTQVQEWKNTLIRGHDAKQLDKYWGRFNTNADLIKGEYQQLLGLMPSSHPSYQHLSDFAQSYPPMIEAYRKGYQAFIDSGKDIKVADKAVAGIDRAPTKSLTSAVKASNQVVHEFRDEMNQRSSSVSFWTYVVILVAVLFSIGLYSWFISTRILRPLNRVTEVSKYIAAGDFTHDIEVTTSDQIGTLSANFNRIQADLSNTLMGIITDLNQLGKLIDTLFEAFHKVRNGLTNQMQETDKLNNNMQEMTQTGETIGESIGSANAFVADSAKQADDGQAMFKQNVAISENMLQATNNASQIIGGLKQHSDDIGNVVNVINGIAEQTNLLALNAAIEAARAGESGRGFAVVADEVRTLANKTQESTQQISDNIASLQSAADKAVQAMSSGNEQAEKSLEQAVNSQAFIDQLHTAFAQITQLNGRVEAAVSSQLQQSNQVNQGLKNIENLSELSQHEAKVMEDASKVLSQIFRNIEKETKVFKIRNTD